MQLERKALYNLLRMNKDPSLKAKAPSWQIEDYRNKELSVLFSELKALGIQLDKETFLHYAEEHSSPEDLLEVFSEEEEKPEQEDHVFLIFFELWRRLLPTNPSISIFCDEVDEQIFLYDEGKLKSDEKLQEALTNLQSIMEEHFDRGQEPQVVFESIASYFANDLESFLYDFIVNKIEEEETLYASELLEGFYPFVHDKAWFDFLKARLLSVTNPGKANSLISTFLEQENDTIDPELNLEILQFLAHYGESELFFGIAKKTLPALETEDEFQDLLSSTADYFHSLDLEKDEAKIQAILKKRSKNSSEAPLNPKDEDVLLYLKLCI